MTTAHSGTSRKTVHLCDEDLFDFENGIWTGKKQPFVDCAVLRNTNFGEEGTLDYSKVASIAIEARMLQRKKLLPGDIIIERSGGGPTQPVGRVAYFDKENADFCFSNFTSRLRVRKPEVVDPRFLHLFLLFLHVSGETEALQRRTTGIRNLDFNEYLKTAIPVPPIVEQRVIAHLLQAVRKAKEARQHELDLQREQKAALTELLFTSGVNEHDPSSRNKLPEGWRLIGLGGVIQSGPQNGIYKPQNLYGAGTGIVRIDDFDHEGNLTSPMLLRVRLSSEEIENYRLSTGDILINRVNSLSHLGKSLFVGNLEEPAVFESNMMRFKVDESRILAIYLAQYLLSDSAKAYLRGRAKRAVAQSSINQGDVLSLPVPLPTLQEQQQIAAILMGCVQKIRAIQHEIGLLGEFFLALLEELMNSKLSVASLTAQGIVQ